MASLKELIHAYRDVNKDFRHNFDGENWEIWMDDRNYPTFRRISTDELISLLKRQLGKTAIDYRNKAAYLYERAEGLDNLLKE